MDETPIDRWPASGPGRSRLVAWQGLVFAVANARTPGAPLQAQLDETFQILDAALRDAGTTRASLLSVQVILQDIADRGAFDAAWRQWIGDDPAGWPQRAVFGAQLAPGLLVEIVATAARGSLFMSEPRLLVDCRDGVMVATLNRPAKLNAIDNELARQLLAAIAEAGRDDAVRVLLLRGAGRAFCAGRDVGAPPTPKDLELVQAVAQAMVTLPKPVVAAVHGWTVGAGLEWMLDADVVVAAANSRFRLPEASLGVFVTGGLAATLPAFAGLARAKALMLLGDEFDAVQAQAWGLVWEVVDPADLEAASLRIAARLAALRPDVVARFKKVLNEVGLGQFERAIALENEAQTALDVQARVTRSGPPA